MLSYFIIIFYIVTIFAITVVYKIFNPNNKELLRKIIHIGIGPLIPIAKYLDIGQTIAIILTGVISFLILLNYKYKLFPIIEDVDRKSYGTFFYCFSLLILIILFWNKDPISLIVGFFLMTFGDGLAGLIGKNFQSKAWSIFKQKKSFFGTITMFSSSLLILVSMTYLGGYQLNYYVLIIAIFSTFLEQISVVGVDNLTVPILSSLSFNLLISKLPFN